LVTHLSNSLLKLINIILRIQRCAVGLESILNLKIPAGEVYRFTSPSLFSGGITFILSMVGKPWCCQFSNEKKMMQLKWAML